MKAFALTTAFFLIPLFIFAQKPKEARELNLKTKTTWVTEKKGSKELNYKYKEQRFDKDGNLIEDIEFNSKGFIVHHVAYEYSGDRKTKELVFNKEGKILSRIEYIYSKKGTLSEIQYYDSNSQLIRKEQFIYEQHD